ncbi:anthranilate phosphoribosyltransferase [Clostridium sp. 19966]|uniref:anthranilate phosphoribosyltransferase n=1 Tax=Clostridium sp. 19966 TaxID=2768166 RepID=UPI0028DDFB89|nr:anthranilate phosphoribosyltransferase [Clostridium sp. 19966]MDT8717092.1 anthranilate phosphoribosyltransferase [Clostridium sp. 19966]
MFKDYLNKLVALENISEEGAEECMNEIMSGNCTQSQISAFLVALKIKGETIEEITGCARAMKNKAEEFELDGDYYIDTCGTGGDGGKTFNISTCASIIAASGGVKIAKHGNRAVSSKSGSSDVLSKLGVPISLDTEASKLCLKENNMTFLFAPDYHKAMKYAAPVRGELGMRTIFNILGPLTNPAPIKGQVMGVYSEKLTESMAKVLLKLGRERALVVNGDGLDEITIAGKTKVSELKNGKILNYYIDPREFGLIMASVEEMAGGNSEENAAIIVDILKGKKGPKRDVVLINAAAALYVGKKVENLSDGIEYARTLIDSGIALDKLNQLCGFERSAVH